MALLAMTGFGSQYTVAAQEMHAPACAPGCKLLKLLSDAHNDVCLESVRNLTPSRASLHPADPSSIDSCMIGGMVSNNSSGMCCGVSQNTYHTLKDMRVIFVDGTVLDTSDPASRDAFVQVGQVTRRSDPQACAYPR